MSPTLTIVILAVAALAGCAGYITAYWQVSHASAPQEARRRALGAVPGPLVFYAVLGGILSLAAPLMFQR
jgi:hypothetical protein